MFIAGLYYIRAFLRTMITIIHYGPLNLNYEIHIIITKVHNKINTRIAFSLIRNISVTIHHKLSQDH